MLTSLWLTKRLTCTLFQDLIYFFFFFASVHVYTILKQVTNQRPFFQQRENLSQIGQSEPPALINKSPKETPTRSKKNAKEKGDSKKKDDHKEEKKEVSTTGNQPSANIKEVKEKPKESVKEVKEPKEPVKENVIPLQSSNKESKKIKKKNDILAQIGESNFQDPSSSSRFYRGEEYLEKKKRCPQSTSCFFERPAVYQGN